MSQSTRRHVVAIRRHGLLPRPLKLSLGIAAALASSVAAQRVYAQEWTGATSDEATDPANWTDLAARDFLVNRVDANVPLWTVGSEPVPGFVSGQLWQLNTLSIGVGAGTSGRFDVGVEPGYGPTTDFASGAYMNQASTSPMVIGGGEGVGVFNLNLRNAGESSGTGFEIHFNGPSPAGMQIGADRGTGTVNVLGSGKTVEAQGHQGANIGGVLSTYGLATVGISGGTGTVNVQGAAWALPQYSAAEIMLDIGNGAGSHGTVNVLAGGKLSVNSNAYYTPGTDTRIGSDGGTGVLQVSGSNSGGYSSKVGVGTDLRIGMGAGSQGTFNVLAGGKAANYYFYSGDPTIAPSTQIGIDGGAGQALVSGTGSIWELGGQTPPYSGAPPIDDGTQIGHLHIGPSGNGTLTIADGGVVSLGVAHISDHYSDDFSRYWYELDSFDDSQGTLYLAESNTGVGTLNIGAAAGQAAAAPGTLKAAQIDMGPGTASVVFNHSANDYVFSVPLTGTGTLASYAGTTYLAAPTGQPAGAALDNSGFSGSTAIHGGALGLRYNQALGSSAVSVLDSGGGLIYGSATRIANPIDIAGGATLTASNENGSDAIQLGVISGAGTLRRSGTGSLSLTAVNTLTGETDIEGGTLTLVGNGSIEQSSRVVAKGTFDISAAADDPFIRSLSGNGLVSMGGSQLTLTAANDTFAGSFTGSGPLTLAAGNEVLTGDSSAYTGNTTVAGGSLWVNGTLGANSTTAAVESGGRLGGGGTVGGNVDVAGGGILTPGTGPLLPGLLTIGGNLGFAPGAILEYDFGQANRPGGTFNDLIDVAGNLNLAGTINITQAPGGTFETGIYRVINYGGSLTDLGLTIGTSQVSGLVVQTAIPQQVNLIYIPPGVTLTFWDGDAGPKNNSIINGGDGTWQASAGNDNWTSFSGNPNAPYADGAFAVFASTPGTVTIDNSLGAVTASGLQFASTGYAVQGDTLTLMGAQAHIRVGEGVSLGLLGGVPVAIISAPVAGTAELVKGDVGTLVLSGANTYEGGTRIENGTVLVANDGNLGDASGAITLAGGALANSASFVSPRTVSVDTLGEIATSAGTTLTLSGSVGGNGALAKSGDGTLSLTGDGNFTGTALATGGTLSVDGSVPGAAVTMAGSTTLIGNGTIGATTMQSGAVIAPGHSIGTLTMQGDYLQNDGAVYQVELDPTTANADLIRVNGTATLVSGAGLQVSRVSNALYTLGTRYTVLDAASGLTGNFTLGGDINVSPFAALQDTYDANHAYLEVNQTRRLSDAACSRNPHAAAGGLESTGAGNAALNAIVVGSQSDADACRSLGQLSGEAYASVRGAFLDDSRFLREAVSYRMRSGEPAGESKNDLWVHAFGSWGDYDAHNDTSTFSRDIGGIFLGGDRNIDDAWRLGVVGGYSHTSFDTHELNSSGSSDDYHLGIYAGNDTGHILIHGGLAYTWHDVSMTRHPSFNGYDARLSSDFDAGTAQAWGEIAYDMPGRDSSLQPFFNAAYVRLRTDGFQETGDPASVLAGHGDDSSNTFTTLGTRLIAPLNLQEHTSLEFRMSAGWRHAYGQLSPSTFLNFTGGTPLSVVGTSLDRDALAVDMELGGKLGRHVDGGISYSGVIGSHSGDHGIKAYVRWQF